MLRKTLSLLLTLSPLTAVAVAGGCDKNKTDQKKREQIARQEQQRDGQDAGAQDPFEASGDPPLKADTRFAAGQLAEAQGNLDNAITQYRETLKLNPNHRDAMFRLGGIYTQTRRYNDAIATWQRYIKLTNHSPQAYSNLALCYESAGRFEEAEQTYKAGIDRDPNDQACRTNYGLMLARRNQIDAAIAQLSSVLPPAAVHYNLGAVSEQQGRTEEAKAYYRKALELDPKLRDARSRLAVLK